MFNWFKKQRIDDQCALIGLLIGSGWLPFGIYFETHNQWNGLTLGTMAAVIAAVTGLMVFGIRTQNRLRVQ